jgi:hypothetical protein
MHVIVRGQGSMVLPPVVLNFDGYKYMPIVAVLLTRSIFFLIYLPFCEEMSRFLKKIVSVVHSALVESAAEV